mgnify:CR=1 FL=1
MAKPQMLFGYQPPAAMSQMGQGVAEGMAKAGQLYGEGLASMGKSIGQGIVSATSAIADYKQITDSANALKKAVKSLPDDDYGSKEFMMSFLEDPSISDLQKSKMGGDMLGAAVKNMMELRRIQEMNRGRLDLQGMRGQGGTAPVRFQSYDLNQPYQDEDIQFNGSSSGYLGF